MIAQVTCFYNYTWWLRSTDYDPLKIKKKPIIPSPTARTNGRTYATDYSVESVSLSDCDVCIVVVAKRCVRTVQQFVGSSGYSSLITIRSSASSG